MTKGDEMSDELVERARDEAAYQGRNATARLLRELADRIEADARRIAALRTALERWQSYGCPDCSGDCGSANPPVACCIMRETMEALR